MLALIEEGTDRLKRTRNQRPPRGIQSITVGASVLRALASVSGPVPLRDVAKAAGMPASKAYRYLVSFAVLCMLRPGDATGLYHLSP